jgi:hypothetical protein
LEVSISRATGGTSTAATTRRGGDSEVKVEACSDNDERYYSNFDEVQT